MPDQAPVPGREDVPGTTRRGMLRGAAGLGAAGAAMAVLVRTAGPATAAAATQAADQGAEHQEPLVVHVHDAQTGVVDLYTGTRHVRVTDRELAARLARAAR
jgi:hypothetical protein